jgi:glycerophosphoryl diester phosphodiesterase
VTFVVAHRAGNDLALLRRAEELGVELVEADVRLWRGRAEVRHLKTLGPIPVLWDKWYLASPLAPRLQLADLLAGAAPETHLLLDLKGRDPRLAKLVLAALPAGRRVTVCARSPRLLEPFAGNPDVRRFRSVGSRRQLRRLLRRQERLDGVSVHERLLDQGVVTALREVAATVLSWPVNSAARAAELAALGVQGLISDDPGRLVERAA